MTDKALTVLYTKTFKKYKAEFEPKVVDHVRGWSKKQRDLTFYEDNSIVKVTGTKPQIDSLLATLKTELGYIPPEDREGAKKSEEVEED